MHCSTAARYAPCWCRHRLGMRLPRIVNDAQFCHMKLTIIVSPVWSPGWIVHVINGIRLFGGRHGACIWLGAAEWSADFQEAHMKDNQHVKPVIDAAAGTVTFHVKGHDSLVLDMAKLHPAIVKRAALAGMAQVRIVDAAAVSAARKDGSIIPEAERIAMKWSNMAELIEHYHTGTDEWSQRASGSGGARSLTIEAIARVKGWDYEKAASEVDISAAAKGMDRKAYLTEIRKAGPVIAAMAAIRAERLPKAKVDADAALAELGG